MKSVKLINKYVGNGFPCYSIAEIGGSFKSFEEGKKLVDDAINVKIDAIKFQTFEADTIVTKNVKFNLKTTGEIFQYDLFKKMEISKELQIEIVEYANKKDIPIFSAPSHIKDVELMEKMNLPIYKIGSDLACHIPLLKKIAKFKKPIILSTGMCTLDEIESSVNAIKDCGNEEIILLHCVSDYPLKSEETNLKAILSLKNKFQLPIGFSDHSIGLQSTLTAISIGANVIERHFHDVDFSQGPDKMISLTKNEFERLIKKKMEIEVLLGDGKKEPSISERKNITTNRVSIIVMKDVMEGDIISEEIIDVRRPGYGIAPIFFESIIGKKFCENISKETPLKWEMIK